MPVTKPRVTGGSSAPIFVLPRPSYKEVEYGTAFTGPYYYAIQRVFQIAGVPMDKYRAVSCMDEAIKVPLNSLYKKTPDAFLRILESSKPNPLVYVFGQEAAVALGVLPPDVPYGSVIGTCVDMLEPQPYRAVCLSHPFICQNEPAKARQEAVRLNAARSQALNSKNRFPKVKHEVVTRPEEIRAIGADISKASGLQRFAAYDFETLGIGIDGVSVNLGLHHGRMEDDTHIPYVIPFLREGEPVGSDTWLKQMKEEMRNFFDTLRRLKSGGRIGHFDHFDATIAHFNGMQEEKFYSQVDTRVVSWMLDPTTGNGLKELAEVLNGHPNYEKEMMDEVDKVVERRKTGPLSQADIKIAKILGIPLATDKKTKELKWPSRAVGQLKRGAYGAVPHEICERYVALDAVETWLAFSNAMNLFANDKHGSRIPALQFRMQTARMYHAMTDSGLTMDVALNAQWQEECQRILEISETAIHEILASEFDHRGDFNIGSDDQLRAVLFGSPKQIMVPTFSANKEQLMAAVGGEVRAKRFLVRLVSDYIASRAITEQESIDVDVQSRDIETFVRETTEQDYGTALFNMALKPYKVYGGAAGKNLYTPVAFTKTGLPAVSRAVIDMLYEQRPTPFLRMLITHRRAAKILGTFLKSPAETLENGKTFPRYNPIGTVSGRASSAKQDRGGPPEYGATGFNGQNQPKYLRGQYIPDPGWDGFFEFDFSQAEYFVAAGKSKDPVMLKALTSGEDFHTATARLMFGVPEGVAVTKEQRRPAKNLNFGVLYLMGAASLAVFLGVSEEVAQEYIDQYYAKYSVLRKYIDDIIAGAKNPPYFVETVGGTRICTLNTLSSDPSISGKAARQAFNGVIQGSTADVVHWTCREFMRRVEKNYPGRLEGKNITHDSFVGQYRGDVVRLENGQPVGPLVDILNEILDQGTPFPDLAGMRFKVDMELNQRWAGAADLRRAIDPQYLETGQSEIWEIIHDLEADSLDIDNLGESAALFLS